METTAAKKPTNVYSGMGSVERSSEILKEVPLVTNDKDPVEEKKISPFSIIGSIERYKKFFAQQNPKQETVVT